MACGAGSLQHDTNGVLLEPESGSRRLCYFDAFATRMLRRKLVVSRAKCEATGDLDLLLSDLRLQVFADDPHEDEYWRLLCFADDQHWVGTPAGVVLA